MSIFKTGTLLPLMQYIWLLNLINNRNVTCSIIIKTILKNIWDILNAFSFCPIDNLSLINLFSGHCCNLLCLWFAGKAGGASWLRTHSSRFVKSNCSASPKCDASSGTTTKSRERKTTKNSTSQDWRKASTETTVKSKSFFVFGCFFLILHFNWHTTDTSAIKCY